MRWNKRIVLSLALATWVLPCLPSLAQQQAPPPREGNGQAPAARPKAAPVEFDPGGKRMQLILAAWAKKSTQLKSLDLNIKRIDKSAKWNDEEYEGRAMFMTPNLAFLDFSKVQNAKGADKRKVVRYERIICTGKEVWQYSVHTQQLFIHELGAKDRQRALQEGPLPFLFNFRAADAKERYEMKLIREDELTFVIAVYPRLKIDQEFFSRGLIALDKSLLLPNRILLTDPEGKNNKDFQLTDIKPNAKVEMVNFVGTRPKPPWKIIVNKEGEGPPAQPVEQEARAGQPRQAQPRQAIQRPPLR